VDWLGEVPEHWEVLPLKRFASLRSGESITAEQIEEDGEYPVFGGNGLRGYTDRYNHEGHFALVGRQGALCGNVNYAQGKFWASEHAVVATPVRPLATFWLGELMRAMNLNQYSVSAAQPGISVDAIANLRIPAPPLPEQRAIADFLDRETGRIDALVGKKRELIARLKEKRAARITRAVTRGLDPAAKLKDSGVEWLGMVPEGWEMKRVKHVVASLEQGWSPQCESYPMDGPDEWGVLKVGCVNGGTFTPGENKRLPPELEPVPELGIREGDLLISRANTRDLVGSAAAACEDYPNLLLCDKLYRLRLRSRLCTPRFLADYLGIRMVRGQIELDATGASDSMQNIGQSTILELAIALPPLAEQRAIAEYLDRETGRLDRLTASIEAAIERLSEYRAALITAAVTGKIDVREAHKPEG
jgi:type I restriction enzyme S subunit